MEAIDGVVYEVPLASEVPPVGAAYQYIVPTDAVAPSVTVPVPQLDAGVVPVIVGVVVTVKIALLLLAVVEQPLITQRY